MNNYPFNLHFLDDTSLNNKILNSSPLNDKIMNNYPFNLHVLNNKLSFSDSSFNTYSKKSKSTFVKLLKLISGVHPEFFNNYLFLIDSSRKASFECLKTLKTITQKVPETGGLLPYTISKFKSHSNWTYFSSHWKHLQEKGLKIPISFRISDFNYENSKLSDHFLAVDFPEKLDPHKKFNPPKIGLFDVVSLESNNSAPTKILGQISQINTEYTPRHLLMETFLRCKTSFSGKKVPLIKARRVYKECLPDIDHSTERTDFNDFLNIHGSDILNCNINSPVDSGSISRNFHKICSSENSPSILNTLLNSRSYDVTSVSRRFQELYSRMHKDPAKCIFDNDYSGETFKSGSSLSSKRDDSIKYIFQISIFKKYSAFVRNLLNSTSSKKLIKFHAYLNGIDASKKPGSFSENSFNSDHSKKLIYNRYISVLTPLKKPSLFKRYFIDLAYSKKDMFNTGTSDDSSFVKNLNNIDSRNSTSVFKNIHFTNFRMVSSSENSPFLLNTLLNSRSYDVTSVSRRFQELYSRMHKDPAKCIFDNDYSGETFKSGSSLSSKRDDSIKYIFQISIFKKYSAFVRNLLNSTSSKKLIKFHAYLNGIDASKKPGSFSENSFNSDHSKKLIYNRYISVLTPLKKPSLFKRYFIDLAYSKKDMFNTGTSDDSSFVKNLNNIDSRNSTSVFKNIHFTNFRMVSSSENSPFLLNSHLFNSDFSKNLGHVLQKSLKIIPQKNLNIVNLFDTDSSKYLSNRNYSRYLPESLKRTNIFQNSIRFRPLVKKIENNPEQRKVPSPGKQVHNTGKVGKIYSYAAKKLFYPESLPVSQAGLLFEKAKLLKMNISISMNLNLTNIIEGYLEGYFQKRRNKLSFTENPYSKKTEPKDADYLQNKRNKLSFTDYLYGKKENLFMDNPRDRKTKLPSSLSSVNFSTTNFSTKNMILPKRKTPLLKTGSWYRIPQIIVGRNGHFILKHQALAGVEDSNLMLGRAGCKAENFFLGRRGLFGFKTADDIDYFQVENNLPVGNENLVYRSQENEITQNIVEEVEKIKKVVFNTREVIIENSSKDTFLNSASLKQKTDIDYISEKVYQLIGHKMKIEAERRGIL